MDSGTATPLTLKDLQQELEAFAQGWLARSLREALAGEHDAIADKVCERMKAEMGPGQMSSNSLAQCETVPVVDEHKPRRVTYSADQGCGERKTVAAAWRDDGDDSSESTSLWQPSLKYEAKATLWSRLSRRKSTRRTRNTASFELIEESTDGSYSHLPLVDHSSSTQTEKLQARLRILVESALFEQLSGFMVLLNAISLGYDTEYMTKHPDGAPSEITYFTEIFFCILFVAELLLRLAAFRIHFFTMEGWRWNVLDLCLVLDQVVEQALILFSWSTEHHANFGIFRVLRLLRIVRIARLLRAFHLFDDLRVIVSSILSSVSSLTWSIFLLVILIYVFSLIFLQSIVGVGPTEHHEQIQYWFASLFRTFLTMFECVVGGVSWDEVVSPIVTDISPLLGVLFCVYIAACLFAMMNLLTGVFVDKAMMSVREDKDVVLAKRIRDLFMTREYNEDDEVEDEITWEVFSEKLKSPAMMDYFMQINVEVSEAKLLFDLMDVDGSGSLNSEEIIQACLRLRGPARSLELSVLMKEVGEIQKQMTRMATGMRSLEVGLRQLPHR